MLCSQLTLVILAFIPCINTILDDDILYDIKWHPVLDPLVEMNNGYMVTTKRNEKYSCVLPVPQRADIKSPETVLLSTAEPLIETFHSKKLCTYRVDTYWTYEVCHGAYIRQYHKMKTADKKKVTQEYFLGYYYSTNQDVINNAENQQALKIEYKTIDNRVLPTLPIRYTDGTECDINSNTPRETRVFYVCAVDSQDDVIHFQEVSSCQYEIIVASSWVCNMPEFSPADLNQYSINCYAQDNARRKPRNLQKLEHKQKLSMEQSEGAQFTMTSEDGTTFVITYKYVNKDNIDDLAQVDNDMTNTITIPIQPEESNDKLFREYLERFFTGQDCLTGGTGWWKYEICYGKQVIQFHEENQQRTYIVLGKWDAQKHIEWINKNPEKKFTGKQKKERQYVSLYYSDGEICELTKSPRVVEVKLKCSTRPSESSAQSMYLVEPESCLYILGVESPAFCNLIDYLDENGIPDLAKLFPEQ